MSDKKVNATKLSLHSSEPDSLTELAWPQLLPNSVTNYDEYKFKLDMQTLRNEKGLALPLQMCMERFAVSQTGRLPFLRSSNLMDDVLTGRCNEFNFSDYLTRPAFEQQVRSPHIVMEEFLGLQL